MSIIFQIVFIVFVCLYVLILIINKEKKIKENKIVEKAFAETYAELLKLLKQHNEWWENLTSDEKKQNIHRYNAFHNIFSYGRDSKLIETKIKIINDLKIHFAKELNI